MKRIVAAAVCILLVLAVFAGCNTTNPVGTYVVKSIDGMTVEELIAMGLEDTNMPVDMYMRLIGLESLDDYMVLKLEPGFVAYIKYYAVSEPSVGTWTRNGSKIIINIDDYPAEYTPRGNELTATLGDHYYVFEKK